MHIIGGVSESYHAVDVLEADAQAQLLFQLLIDLDRFEHLERLNLTRIHDRLVDAAEADVAELQEGALFSLEHERHDSL
jgi:hypothetical protein